jgi:hypothetical protein
MNAARQALTRHFIRHFLDVGVMTGTEVADGVRRAMLGALSAVLAIGLFLPRLIARKYAGIRGVADLYEATVTGDALMLIGFAMLVAAFAAALAGDSMFPDETDFRVLTPLPVSRGLVFGAKLRAVAVYLGLVIVVASVALLVPFTAVSGGPYADRPWLARAGANTVAAMGGALFAAATVMAVQGALVLCAPGRYLRPLTVGIRTAMLCGIVLLLPLAGRLPDQGSDFVAESRVLYAVPAAWFVAAQRVALGSASLYDVRLASLAIAGFALTSLIVAACYLVLYRRFDVLMTTPPTRLRLGPGTSLTRLWHRSETPSTSLRHDADAQQSAVIARFAARTMWRSPLQQVVFLGTTACGLGWAFNGLLAAELADWTREGGVPPPRLVAAVTTTPFTLLLAGVTGLRLALMLPQDPRANWIFRLREEDRSRGAQLDAVERLFMRLVVLPILAGILPLQWLLIGADVLITLPIVYLMGVVLVELVIRGWRRIPFTCGYIPGKRNVAHTVLLALIAYVFFTSSGRLLIAVSRFHPSGFLVAAGVLLMIVALLRWARLRSWGRAPLMFDDDPPEIAQPIQLL